MTCELCELVAGRRNAAIVYEDDKLVAFLADRPASAGHIRVVPKDHVPIFEEVSDELIKHCFNVANKLCVAAFESIGATGTNILVQNGIEAGQKEPHFSVHVLSRREDDGITFDWMPKQMTQEQMSTIELQIKTQLAKKPAAELLKKEEDSEGDGEEQIDEKPIESKQSEDYRVKQLRRIP